MEPGLRPRVYYFVLVVFVVVTAALWTVVRSPFGMALLGIRESERRMEVLGYDTWRYKYVAFVLAGVVAGLSGNLYVYYNGFVSPAYLSIVFSAMALIMVILGGAGTLLGPALGGAAIVLLENVVSSHTERWLTVLGVIYVVVTLFAPPGIVGLVRGRLGARRRDPGRRAGPVAPPISTIEGSFTTSAGCARSTTSPSTSRGRAAGHPRAQRRRQDDALQSRHRPHPPSSGRIRLFGRDVTACRPPAGASGTRPHVPGHDAVPAAHRAGECAARRPGGGPRALHVPPSPGGVRPSLRAGRAAPRRVVARTSAGRCRSRELSYGEQRQLELLLALATNPRVLLLDEPTAGLSPAETASVAGMIRRFPRDVTILLIEHDMDVALELAERLIVLHYGRVIAAGPRDEIKRDPRVAEIYLGVEEPADSRTGDA